MSGKSKSSRIPTGRWIRPVSQRRDRAVGDNVRQDIDDWAGIVLDETRRRVSGLSSLARRLEDEIRDRWEENETEVKRRRENVEEELDGARRDAESKAQEARRKAEKEGRAEGFREGFARGREDYRAYCIKAGKKRVFTGARALGRISSDTRRLGQSFDILRVFEPYGVMTIA